MRDFKRKSRLSLMSKASGYFATLRRVTTLCNKMFRILQVDASLLWKNHLLRIGRLLRLRSSQERQIRLSQQELAHQPQAKPFWAQILVYQVPGRDPSSPTPRASAIMG